MGEDPSQEPVAVHHNENLIYSKAKITEGVRMSYLTFLIRYVEPVLIMLLIVCVVYFVVRCVLLVCHFGKLKTLSALRRGQPSTSEMVDTEMMVRRDKRHMTSTTMAAIVIAVVICGINWYAKHGM